MHKNFEKADGLSRDVIGAAIEVHRALGAGLLESIYEKCLMHELELRRIRAARQEQVTIEYKGIRFEETLKFGVLVEGCLLLELKAVQEVLPIHKAQVISYMKLLDVPLALLINFHEFRLVDGVSRLLLPNSNRFNRRQRRQRRQGRVNFIPGTLFLELCSLRCLLFPNALRRSLPIRPNRVTRNRHADTPERATRGDIKSFQILASKGAVGDFISRNGNKRQKLSFRREHVNSRRRRVGGFVGRVRFVKTRRDVEPA